MDNNQFDIEGNACNPWVVSDPRRKGSLGSIYWAGQITAPLPLEAIADLFVAALKVPVDSPLLPVLRPEKNKVSVTQQISNPTPTGFRRTVSSPMCWGFSLL
jgi:hypothetical protein